jgi:hypothetical protein
MAKHEVNFILINDEKNHSSNSFGQIGGKTGIKKEKAAWFKVKFLKKVFALDKINLLLVIMSLALNFVLLQFGPPQQQVAEGAKRMTTNSQFLNNDRLDVADFTTHPAWLEFGAKINVVSNQLTARHSNCDTPNQPPLENGCNFTLSPKLLSQNNTLMFYNLEIVGELPSGSKVFIHTRNLSTGLISAPLGEINQTGSPVPLNYLAGNSDALLFNVQNNSDKSLIINALRFYFFDFNKFSQVIFKFDNPPKETTGKIVLDINANSQYEPDIDTHWVCRDPYPGTAAMTITQGQVLLKREDKCLEKVPTAWSSDNHHLALPAGNWLLVVNDGQKVFPFRVEADDSNVINIEF